MKLLHDSWLLFRWNMRATLRNPVWTIIGLFQPLCYLFLFAPLLNGISQVPGFPPGGALTVFTPGLMIMMGIFGTAFAGFELLAELRAGVIERLRVTPVSRLALLLGRVLRDVVILLFQSLLLVLIALPLGIHVSPVGLVFILILLILLGLCMTSCSYALALSLKDENSLSSLLTTLTLPIMLLSGITLPLTLAPPVLRTVAALNPFSYAVSAARTLFLNGNLADVTVIESFAIMGILTLLAIVWAERAFRHAAA